jgi:hypothetical protein
MAIKFLPGKIWSKKQETETGSDEFVASRSLLPAPSFPLLDISHRQGFQDYL